LPGREEVAASLGFSSCPDEEGTERTRPGAISSTDTGVSAVVPMRRELKEHRVRNFLRDLHSFSSCPDEEGTESATIPLAHFAPGRSFSSCPDEEGTESTIEASALTSSRVVSAVVPMRRELKGRYDVTLERWTVRFSSCPDEEGTESVSAISFRVL